MIGGLLGPYRVVAAIGAGGMGEVYRARDTNLNRDVALKILPESFAADPDRLARFKREAQVLASLNHPNIAQIYGVEQNALVMELVDGEDLSQRLSLGAMPMADVLPVARQIAEALEYAHEQGVVHRDLKPANIKIRADGTVKVLDFGLAKVLGPDASGARTDIANSPTFSLPASELGVILGTAAYMAPEQARGRAVDKRADIWAFGVLLYEMLTGTRAFDGQSVPDILAAVAGHEIDWGRLPLDTPPRLRQLLTRCLDADVKQRLRDIGEARVTIATIERGQDAAVDPGAVAQPRRRWRERLAWSIAALTVLSTTTIVVWQRMALNDARSALASTGNQPTRLSVTTPPGFLMNPDSTNVAISPNGLMVAFVVGTGVSSENQLWVRSLDTPTPRRIEAGDGVAQPFWSPDSERIGFFAGGKLKTVAASGGTAEVVCDAPFGRGATWNATNVIVFAPDSTGPLYRVSTSGGTATVLTALDRARKETGHRYPIFLPDGDHFLFAATPGADGLFQIFAASLTNPQMRTFIGSMESAPVYAEPGWLLSTRQGVLAAQPFDPKGLRLTGDAASLGDLPAVAPGPAAYEAGRRVSASVAGTLAYFQESSGNTAVQWMDLTGTTTRSVSVPPGRYSFVALAPDNRNVVLVRSDSATTSSMWLVDLARASAVPLWTGSGKNPSPAWSPDSTRIVYATERDGHWGLYEKTVMDTSAERLILRVDDSSVIAQDWSKDGIVFNRIEPQTRWNIYRTAASATDAPLALVRGPAIEVGGWTSPDHQWLAYLSDEAGHLDLYVQSLPDGHNRTQVATGGIQKAWWTPDGRHLLFTKRDQTLWRVDVDLRGTSPRIDSPVRLAAFPSSLVAMDLAADGRQFLVLVPEHAGLGSVMIVQSWRSVLTRRASLPR